MMVREKRALCSMSTSSLVGNWGRCIPCCGKVLCGVGSAVCVYGEDGWTVFSVFVGGGGREGEVVVSRCWSVRLALWLSGWYCCGYGGVVAS